MPPAPSAMTFMVSPSGSRPRDASARKHDGCGRCSGAYSSQRSRPPRDIPSIRVMIPKRGSARGGAIPSAHFDYAERSDEHARAEAGEGGAMEPADVFGD